MHHGLNAKIEYVFGFIIAGIISWFVTAPYAHGQDLTTDFEIKGVPNVENTWQTVSLENSYTDAIVICSYNLPSSASPPAVTRIQNISANSFQLRAQLFASGGTVTPSNAHCIIADEGPYDSGGLKCEARKVPSTGTSGLSVPANWGVANTEDVTSSATQTYANPHVVGQVMSANDSDASVFWNFDCETRGNGAYFSGQVDGICGVNILDKSMIPEPMSGWVTSRLRR